MKQSFLSAVGAACLMAAPASALEIGQPAPDFTAKDISGKEQTLSAYKGKIVVLEWTNPECPFVHKHYDGGNMQSVQTYAAEKDVVWLSINSSGEGMEGNMSAEAAAEVVKKNKAVPTGYILDPKGEIGHLYEAKSTPHMFVVDKDGALAYEGAIDDKPTPDPADIPGAKNYVKAAIDALTSGGKIETAKTRAYGCSVKYKD